MVYADFEHYHKSGATILTEENAEQELEKASRMIDVMTHNRIIAIEYENLTPFQKDSIQRACCYLADFNVENEDLINSPIGSYSINGVTLNLENNSFFTNCNGILVPKFIEGILMATGLLWGGV